MINLIACKSGKISYCTVLDRRKLLFPLLQIPSLTFLQFLTRLDYVSCFYLLLYSWKYWKRSCLTYFKGMFKLKIISWFKTLTFGKTVLVNEVKTIFIKHCFTKKLHLTFQGIESSDFCVLFFSLTLKPLGVKSTLPPNARFHTFSVGVFEYEEL